MRALAGVAVFVAMLTACGKPCAGLRAGQDTSGLPLELRTTGSPFGPTPPSPTDSQHYEVGPATEYWCCTVSDAGSQAATCAQTEAKCLEPSHQGLDVYRLGAPYTHVNGLDDRDICGVIVKDGKVVAAFSNHDG